MEKQYYRTTRYQIFDNRPTPAHCVNKFVSPPYIVVLVAWANNAKGVARQNLVDMSQSSTDMETGRAEIKKLESSYIR